MMTKYKLVTLTRDSNYGLNWINVSDPNILDWILKELQKNEPSLQTRQEQRDYQGNTFFTNIHKLKSHIMAFQFVSQLLCENEFKLFVVDKKVSSHQEFYFRKEVTE